MGSHALATWIGRLLSSYLDWQLCGMAALAMLGLFGLTGAVRARKRRSMLRLLSSEDGAAYTLSLVLCLPLYALLIALVIETTLLCMVKIGTAHAAYRAARALIVWLPTAADPSICQRKVQLAAIHAMVPFASSDPAHASTGGAIGDDPRGNLAYLNAFTAFASHVQVSGEYLRAKREYARRAVSVRWRRGTRPREVVVTVSYAAPIRIPGMGRLLGTKLHPSGGYFTRTVSSQAMLLLEQPVSATGSLGIRYVRSY